LHGIVLPDSAGRYTDQRRPAQSVAGSARDKSKKAGTSKERPPLR
jgi:hypothetical protein